ncbi:hypothetical protein TEA_016372 [Camellia sinensis var. sinensis]|uniref:Dihydroflavonol 4-reductase n=1 Tax=Camellia sinensis var. sinensis TaxID=542762 RepID=A0A4V3WJL0_CAMSN|nr:hypothetical protein TEA_016372 [Camellia sinensis var. sinensis]
MESFDDKGSVCVTGGTGYVASWLIKKLLENGYKVRTTIRSSNHRDSKKDLSYLTNLPCASEKLQIFNADLDLPESFDEAIQGCIGVFHVAHPVDYKEKEPEEVKIQRAINGTLGILKACLHSKTVKRVVFTSSASTIMFNDKDSKKDLSYLTNLPCASEKLQIFNADLDLPESFDEAIQGCIGVFHVAHPVDYGEKEPEEIKIQRAINGTLGILKACLDSKTVKRVVYTSSASTIMFNDKGLDVLDENHWSDIDYIRSVKIYGVSYMISKTLTEKAALEFAEKHGLDLVTVIPTVVNGPFICPRVPSSVNFSMAMIFGKKENCKYLGKIQMVHVDDVASAHIFLFEYPHAKGSSLKEIEIECFTRSDFSSKKLLDTGFKYKYRLEEMYDETIQCCKEKGFL